MIINRPLYRVQVLVAAGLICLLPARAQTSLEYSVKAAYLTKFAPFIEWPDTVFPAANSPVTICVLGADPFGVILDRAAGSGGAARPLAVRRISGADQATGCQIVYLGDPQAGGLGLLAGKPVVTVTDSGLPEEGVISFVMLDNHVRFDIDDAAAARDGIRISSKLLELAHNVRRRSGP